MKALLRTRMRATLRRLQVYSLPAMASVPKSVANRISSSVLLGVFNFK